MAAVPSKLKPKPSRFRQFFFRGLAILLPTVLTIWIFVAVYNFVDQKIAVPINGWVKQGVIEFTNLPSVSDSEVNDFEQNLTPEQRNAWRSAGQKHTWLVKQARAAELESWWQSIAIGGWAIMDLVGLLIAAVLIYTVGRILGSFIGKRVYQRFEGLLHRLPVFKQIYPHVKQVTDFLVGGDSPDRLRFSKVVAVEYPRKGMWSVGLVTGDTMKTIQIRAGRECMTVFVPSSPTPFTGYVITVPVEDTIELNIPIDAALKFTVSGGVIVPPTEVIGDAPVVDGVIVAEASAEPAGGALPPGSAEDSQAPR